MKPHKWVYEAETMLIVCVWDQHPKWFITSDSNGHENSHDHHEPQTKGI